MSVFGVLSDRGRGHVVTTILIAMVAMLFTAISYGRMARAYPSAGSAFTYVGQEINPALGYITGWSMVMDYMLNPIICTVWCSQQAHVFAPGVPYWIWAIFFALVFTVLNIQGVKTSARMNSGIGHRYGRSDRDLLCGRGADTSSGIRTMARTSSRARFMIRTLWNYEGRARRNVDRCAHLHRF